MSAVGDLAVRLLMPTTTDGYAPASVTELEAARITGELEAAGYGWLRGDDGIPAPDKPFKSRPDGEIQLELARVGAGDESVESHYVRYLTAAAAAWVQSGLFLRQLQAVVRELLRHETISGEHLSRTLEQVKADLRNEGYSVDD